MNNKVLILASKGCSLSSVVYKDYIVYDENYVRSIENEMDSYFSGIDYRKFFKDYFDGVETCFFSQEEIRIYKRYLALGKLRNELHFFFRAFNLMLKQQDKPSVLVYSNVIQESALNYALGVDSLGLEFRVKVKLVN